MGLGKKIKKFLKKYKKRRNKRGKKRISKFNYKDFEKRRNTLSSVF